jgi:hypothetical protein
MNDLTKIFSIGSNVSVGVSSVITLEHHELMTTRVDFECLSTADGHVVSLRLLPEANAFLSILLPDTSWHGALMTVSEACAIAYAACLDEGIVLLDPFKRAVRDEIRTIMESE